MFLHRLHRVLFFTHLCMLLHCPPEWWLGSIQILCILGFKKGAKRLQHILFSKFYCSLRSEWSFLCLEIFFMQSSVLCRAGLCFALWQKNNFNLFCPMFLASLVLWASSILTLIDLSLVMERKSFPLRLFPLYPPQKGRCIKREGVCSCWQ